MRFLFLLTLLYLSLDIKGQQAYSTGAEWHYEYFSAFQLPSAQESGYEILSESGMTTIAGQQYQQIDRQRVVWSISTLGDPNAQWTGPQTQTMNPLFVRKQGDVVYYLIDSLEYVLFDYGASIGDSWPSKIVNGDLSPIASDTAVYTSVVADTGMVLINGSIRRYIDIEGQHPDGYSIVEAGRAIEGIGFIGNQMGFLFPDYSTVIGYQGWTELETFKFNCFESSTESIYQLADYCSTSPLGISDYEVIDATVYPNPTSSVLRLNTSKLFIEYIRLYDLDGRLVLIEEVQGSEFEIDISRFSAGSYILHFMTDHGLKVNESALIKLR